MGRKPRGSTDGNGRDGPAILERLLGGAHPEVLNIRRTPPLEEPAARSALARIPTCFLLDVSSSMFASGGLGAVARALPGFRQAILSDSLTARKLHWAFLTYAETPKLVRDYGPIADWEPPAEIESGTSTAMATAIIEMFRIQDEHVEKLAAQGVPLQRKFCVHVTDGEPNSEPPELMEEAARLIEQAEESGTFSFFNIYVEGANVELLKRLTPRRTPLRLADVKDFSLFFRWLNASLRTTSHSMAGERVALPNPMKSAENPVGWADI